MNNLADSEPRSAQFYFETAPGRAKRLEDFEFYPSTLPASTSNTRAICSKSEPRHRDRLASADQLNSQLTTLQNRSTALNSLNGKFSALQWALQGVSNAVVSASAQVSDNSVLTAQSDPSAKAGSYAIDLVTAGAPPVRSAKALCRWFRILPRNPSRQPVRSR